MEDIQKLVKEINSIIHKPSDENTKQEQNTYREKLFSCIQYAKENIYTNTVSDMSLVKELKKVEENFFDLKTTLSNAPFLYYSRMLQIAIDLKNIINTLHNMPTILFATGLSEMNDVFQVIINNHSFLKKPAMFLEALPEYISTYEPQFILVSSMLESPSGDKIESLSTIIKQHSHATFILIGDDFNIESFQQYQNVKTLPSTFNEAHTILNEILL